MIQRFERCLPEEVGIPSEAIDAFLDELENGGFTQMHGLMIMRHGKVCAEGWWAPFAPGLHHCDHSLSKTYTATAIGLAEYQGLLKLSDRVCDILPDKMPAQMSDRLSRRPSGLLVMGDGWRKRKRPIRQIGWSVFRPTDYPRTRHVLAL
ncbi:MAG: serine hydrolase [Christensenellales bacterium]